MREKLIAAGIKNIKDFGYSGVTETNILTDLVYSAFFKSMLEDNLGHSKEVDKVINELLKEITNER